MRGETVFCENWKGVPDGPTDRRTDRQTDRQTERQRQRESSFDVTTSIQIRKGSHTQLLHFKHALTCKSRWHLAIAWAAWAMKQKQLGSALLASKCKKIVAKKTPEEITLSFILMVLWFATKSSSLFNTSMARVDWSTVESRDTDWKSKKYINNQNSYFRPVKDIFMFHFLSLQSKSSFGK